jgi:hypothetical protein
MVTCSDTVPVVEPAVCTRTVVFNPFFNIPPDAIPLQHFTPKVVV